MCCRFAYPTTSRVKSHIIITVGTEHGNFLPLSVAPFKLLPVLPRWLLHSSVCTYHNTVVLPVAPLTDSLRSRTSLSRWSNGTWSKTNITGPSCALPVAIPGPSPGDLWGCPGERVRALAHSGPCGSRSCSGERSERLWQVSRGGLGGLGSRWWRQLGGGDEALPSPWGGRAPFRLYTTAFMYYLPEVEPWGNMVDQGLCRKRNETIRFHSGPRGREGGREGGRECGTN